MPQEAPITFTERDEFNRKNIAEKVIKLLSSDIQVSPLVIDGSWGLGKTEFCHKLINLMKENNTHHLIYIDAFKVDHADEPLLTVLAKVLEVLPNDEDKAGLIKKAIPALRYGLKVVAKACVSHALRQDTDSLIDGFDEQVKQVADAAIDSSVEALLKDHMQADQSLKALKNALAAIAQKKPIVLFIDELDRCRPDFAVLMLETIKHTFDVNGVKFVLITNTDQLKASINHCYGTSIDAQRYLDKFLKFTFTLPNTTNQNQHEAILASARHYKNSVVNSPILKELELSAYSYSELITQVITINKLSLREVETLIRYLEIYESISNDGLSNKKMSIYNPIVLLGILLVSIKPNLANAALSNELDAKQLGAFMGVDNIPDVIDASVHQATTYEVLAVMLGMECKHNSSLFSLKEPQQRTYWKDLINRHFSGLDCPPMEGKRLNILTDAIKTIYLMN
ncbi:AAA family ATPase [Shewanella sp. SNU WT4]|nr:AAA family ATPase [Shewanella sp. SNU WT4]